MKDDNCIFCKLANGEIPTNTLYEDDGFRVILDGSPAAAGHALVIPKNHFANVYEMDAETVGGAAQVAAKAAKKIAAATGCDGINILQNNGEAAGQTVFHYHVHIIPRFTGDDAQVRINWDHKSFTDEETEEIRRKLSF